MLKDILGQAWEAMVYNRRRTAITMVGMAWGIATVVLLVAYGAGFSNAVETIFSKFGTNTIIFWGGRTSQQAGGDKAGAGVRFTLDDIDRVSNSVPGTLDASSDFVDTKYLDSVWLDYRGDHELVEKALRETMGAAHHFRPSDHNAMGVANLMSQVIVFRLLSIALSVLLTLVGALTLGIAGIGLMNIMLVAVQQRTREIGIEK